MNVMEVIDEASNTSLLLGCATGQRCISKSLRLFNIGYDATAR